MTKHLFSHTEFDADTNQLLNELYAEWEEAHNNRPSDIYDYNAAERYDLEKSTAYAYDVALRRATMETKNV